MKQLITQAIKIRKHDIVRQSGAFLCKVYSVRTDGGYIVLNNEHYLDPSEEVVIEREEHHG